jgi:hypothetical protein
MSTTPITRRALFVAVAVVLGGQVATLYGVYRMSSHDRVPVERASLSLPTVLPVPVTQATLGPTTPESSAQATAGNPQPTAPHLVEQPTTTTLAPDVRRFSDEISVAPNDLGLFADAHGEISDIARRDLRVGHEAAMEIARENGLGARSETLASIAVGYMLRRVSVRAALRNTRVAPGAIDATVRKDALATAQANFGDQVTSDLEPALARPI